MLLADVLTTAGLTGVFAGTAQAAGEQVNIWLTTTSDSGGRTVTRGLQPQTPVTFQPGNGGGTNLTVNENTKYQTFTGGGASFTNTAAWPMKGSGALSQATRDDTMRKLFSPTDGIGLSFIRNPLGGSDLARFGYTFVDMPAGRTDPDLSEFSIAHDPQDVLPLTKQAKQLNPALTTKASPWPAPAWTKDNGRLNGGRLKIEYDTMGHLTKFVTPGAHRIESTAGTTVPNVAWQNPNGSKALIAYNEASQAREIRVNWGGQNFGYSLPAKTSATFTWAGGQSGGGGGGTAGALTGLGGKCLDVTGNSSANGAKAQLWSCTGAANQKWRLQT